MLEAIRPCQRSSESREALIDLEGMTLTLPYDDGHVLEAHHLANLDIVMLVNQPNADAAWDIVLAEEGTEISKITRVARWDVRNVADMWKLVIGSE